MEILRRLWLLINRRRFEREMRLEMAYHREMLAKEGGRTFGSELRWQEDAREVWGWAWLDRLWQDLSYGARVLRKSPSFTITATLVLGLGIGVTLTAVRGVLDAIRPTVPDPDTLVHLERAAPGSHSTSVSYPQFAFYARNARSFCSVIGETRAAATFGEGAPGQEPETVTVSFVTASYFREMGVRAEYGRLLGGTDEAAGAAPTALLEQHFWERRLGADAGIVGRRVRLNGKLVTVAGILRAGPNARAAVWMPLALQPYLIEGSTLLTDWGDFRVTMSGRLKPGVTPEASEAETRALAARLHDDRPDNVWKGEWLQARTYSSPEEFRDVAIGLASTSLILLILLVACANLGTMLLARGVTRGA